MDRARRAAILGDDALKPTVRYPAKPNAFLGDMLMTALAVFQREGQECILKQDIMQSTRERDDV